MKDCIFCKIASKETPVTIEAESENVIAFKNIAPVADTHILIIPKKHVATFLDLANENLIQEMSLLVTKLITDKKLESGYKLVFNGGKYQHVSHVHWHLLGGEMKDNL